MSAPAPPLFAPVILAFRALTTKARRGLLDLDERELEPALAVRLRTAQFEAATRRSTLMALANIGNALIVVAAAANGRHIQLALGWFATLALYVSPYFWQWRRRRGRPPPTAISHRTVRRLLRHTFGVALIWGAGPALMFDAPPGQQFILATVGVGVAAGGAFALATLPLAAVVYLLPMAAGMIYALTLGAKAPIHFLAAPLMVAYTAALLGLAISHGRAFGLQVIAQARAELAARHDPLTGLPNRAAFEMALADAFHRWQRFGERFAMLSIDLDRFKAVNDRYGHQAGDELLRQAADRLADVLDGRAHVSRLGGDEFTVIARAVGEEKTAEALAADIASRFDAPFALEAGSALCRASIGVALAPIHGADAKSLIAHSDNELYCAKNEAKSAAAAAERSGRADGIQRRRELTREMKASLARGEFFLQYQPVVALRSGRLEGFEALARWRHPSLGLIPPLEFIGIAEKNGFIHELGEWILNEACSEAARWRGQARIAVNVSGEQLCDAAFESIFAGALRASRLAPARVQIEVTESASIAVTDAVARALERLSAAGAEIVLDDFGTGYSSLSLIRRLPVSRLKIDRQFVAGLTQRRDSAAIVEAVIGLARALDFAVTAEGVETRAQRAYLESAGCGFAQGYLIARPLDVHEARTLAAGAPLTRFARAAA